ncbi:MAG: hypothetical protein WBS24_04700 [Terriglobales bacterium]
MRLKQNATTAIVVRKAWATLKAIKLFLRNHSLDEIQSPDDSYLIFARVLDDTDEQGLWIELNTEAHEKNPAIELQALLIPWHAVEAVVIADNFIPAVEQARKLGFR